MVSQLVWYSKVFHSVMFIIKGWGVIMTHRKVFENNMLSGQNLTSFDS